MTLTGPFRRQRGKKTESGHLRLLPLDAVSMATWCSRSKIMRWRSVPRPHAHAHSHTTHTSNRRTWFMSKDNCTIFFIYPTQKSVEYITMLLRSKIKKQQKIHIFLSFTTTSLIFYIIFLFLLHISVCMPLFFRWIQFSFSWELPGEDDLSNMLLPAPRLCVWDKKQWISFLWEWVIIS